MPYLTFDRKQAIATGQVKLTTAGDLTYALTLASLGEPRHVAERSWKDTVEAYGEGRTLRYEDYCTIVGALECTRRELLRRRPLNARAALIAEELTAFTDAFYADVIAPYEDTKIEQNGDVYE